MQLHQIRPTHKSRKMKRRGRGGKRGFYSGRGAKGQSARAGRKMKPIIRELIKKYPKLRGYRFKSRTQNSKSKTAILNLKTIETKFQAGERVNPEALLEKGLIAKIKGGMPRVKILGQGKLTKNLVFENCKVSKSAKEAIEKAGGTIRV